MLGGPSKGAGQFEPQICLFRGFQKVGGVPKTIINNNNNKKSVEYPKMVVYDGFEPKKRILEVSPWIGNLHLYQHGSSNYWEMICNTRTKSVHPISAACRSEVFVRLSQEGRHAKVLIRVVSSAPTRAIELHSSGANDIDIHFRKLKWTLRKWSPQASKKAIPQWKPPPRHRLVPIIIWNLSWLLPSAVGFHVLAVSGQVRTILGWSKQVGSEGGKKLLGG
jgi:hypothetical protein